MMTLVLTASLTLTASTAATTHTELTERHTVIATAHGHAGTVTIDAETSHLTHVGNQTHRHE
jgi:hypothetical protein